ncbi:Protein CWC15-like [Porphyridium purpureum]|uniref:Protein CWC15-like n=1 Tax=Porphyridium purpureum TaxID=35688 RepID=A0A5J4YLS4_PORPP|nr:Protein CWC15-like [Porphyridium purpureum]|eukprot:POR3974..scf244_11
MSHKAHTVSARGAEVQGRWRLGVASARVSGKSKSAHGQLKTRKPMAQRVTPQRVPDSTRIGPQDEAPFTQLDYGTERLDQLQGNPIIPQPRQQALPPQRLEASERDDAAQSGRPSSPGQEVQRTSRTQASSSESSSDDDEDEEAELLAQLEKIRRERGVASGASETCVPSRAGSVYGATMTEQKNSVYNGNPLIQLRDFADSTAPSISRDIRSRQSWTEDVVLREDPIPSRGNRPPAFVNNALQTEFHKRFLDKYIR